jgi:hypothetical protein
VCSRPRWPVVNVLAIRPNVLGFKPCRGRCILKGSTPSFGGEIKLWTPCLTVLRHVKEYELEEFNEFVWEHYATEGHSKHSPSALSNTCRTRWEPCGFHPEIEKVDAVLLPSKRIWSLPCLNLPGLKFTMKLHNEIYNVVSHKLTSLYRIFKEPTNDNNSTSKMYPIMYPRKLSTELLLLIMSMGWDHVSELRPPTGLLFIPHMIHEYGEPRWNIYRSKAKNSDKSLFQWHLFHYKTYMD